MSDITVQSDGTSITVAAPGPQGIQGPEGSGSPNDQQQIIYVSKAGIDTGSGLNFNAAKLTIGAAITAASAMTPSSSNQITVQVIDGGKYQEELTLPEWVHIFGPNAQIDGRIDVSNNTVVTVSRLENTLTSSQCIKKGDSGGLSKVSATIMFVASGQEGVRCDGGQLGLTLGTMVLNNAEGLLVKDGSRITFNIQYVSMINSSDFLKTKVTGGSANAFYGEVLRVEDDNTSRFLNANAVGDMIDVQAGSVAVNMLYDLGTDTVLNLYANTTTGTRIDGTNTTINIMDLAGASALGGDLDMQGNEILNQFSGLAVPGVLTNTTWEPLSNYVDENIFTYSTTTTEADPGSGNIRLDNTNLSLATKIFVSDTTSQGANIDLFVNAMITGTTLTLREFGDFTNDVIFAVDSVVDNTTWFNFGITVIQSSQFAANGVNLLFRVLNIPISHDATLDGLGTVSSPLLIVNPFTAADETKLDGIAPLAEVNTIDSGDNVSDLVNDAGYLAATDFTVLTADGELTAEKSSYDPATEGTGVFTLPTPTAGLNGARRGIWRVGAFSATDYISITGHIEDNASGERRLGLAKEFTKFVCDGATWREDGHTSQAFCTPVITSATTFTLTTGFTKFTSWDTLPIFDTAGRLLWNSTNNQIDIPIVEGDAADGYEMTFNLILEYTNNRTITGVVAIDGTPINGEFPVNALGSGKPLMLHIPIDIGFPTGASTMEIQLKGETAGTLDVLSARWTVNRIKG